MSEALKGSSALLHRLHSTLPMAAPRAFYKCYGGLFEWHSSVWASSGAVFSHKLEACKCAGTASKAKGKVTHDDMK